MAQSTRVWIWPALIAGLFAMSVANVAWLVVSASGDPSFAVEPNYYQKAVNWDATMAREQRNAELGWRLVAELSPVSTQAGGGMLLVVRVANRDGAPLVRAEIAVQAMHNARASRLLSAQLQAHGDDGSYRAVLPIFRAGLWELRFEVEAHGEHFTHVMRRDVVTVNTGGVVARSGGDLVNSGE